MMKYEPYKPYENEEAFTAWRKNYDAKLKVNYKFSEEDIREKDYWENDYVSWKVTEDARNHRNHEIWENDLENKIFWEQIRAIIEEKQYAFRIKARFDVEISQWNSTWFEAVVSRIDFTGNYVFVSIDSYIDDRDMYGPVAKWDIEWIEIDPIIESPIDPDLSTELVDDINQICKKLSSLRIKFSIINHFVRIYIR